MTITKKYLSFSIVLFCIFGVFVSGASAETYWIDDAVGGQNDLNKCKGETPLSGTSACYFKSVDYDGSSIVAGDKVYFRDGTYRFDSAKNGLTPSNSGSPGNMITFSAYNDEEVIFYSNVNDYAETCVNLKNGQDYIKVHGITCQKWYLHLQLHGASYNEISKCTFSRAPDDTVPDWNGSEVQQNSDYNWIHDCTFEKYGSIEYVGGARVWDDNGAVLAIGWEGNDGGSSDDNNVIENNIIQHGSHHVMEIAGKYNVVRNNYLRNDPWITIGNPHAGTYSGRILNQFGHIGEDELNLLEGNRIGYSGTTAEQDQTSGEGALVSQRWIIYRHNVWMQIGGGAWFIHDHSASSSVVAEENYFYNNTVWHNGYEDSEKYKSTWLTAYSHAGFIANSPPTAATNNNVFKNNIFYQNENEGNSAQSIVGYTSGQIFANNWEEDPHGNPLFVDISGTPDPNLFTTQFDFNLRPESRAIDGGTHLTQAQGSGNNSKTLRVADAKYFQDGWGHGAGGGASVEADSIAIGTVGNTVQIQSINYNTNTITLVSGMTWDDNAKIWLYKNSEGNQVLYGTAPDQGAYEFETDQDPGLVAPLTPTNPRIM